MNTQCYHCASPLLESDNYSLHHNNQDLSFCCPACLSVSELILSQDLGDYYQKREGFNAKPDPYDFSIWDKASLQTEFVEVQADQVNAKFYIEGMHCTACAWLIEHHLNSHPKIDNARVNYQQQSLVVTCSADALSVSQIMRLVAEVGYLPHPFQQDQIVTAQKKQRQQQLKRIGITALLMMQLGMLAGGVYAGDYWGIAENYRQLLHAFGLFFSLPLLYFSALPFFSSAFVALKHRTFNMDVNIALAIVGLYAGSVYSVVKGHGDVYFDSIAMLCLFILVARFIEFSSRQQLFQSRGILPHFVNKRVGDQLISTVLTDIVAGDRLLVKPGETIAFDAIVVDGGSSVSEAVINGESKAINKTVGCKVFAGSVNHDGQLSIRVEKTTDQSLIHKIEALTASASNTHEETSDDKFSAIFTGVICLMAMVTYLGWLWIDQQQAFWVALSVLVISCPCALSLAAPTARSVIQYRLRKLGILIKSAAVLDTINAVSHVFFDKTGTLTQGDLSLVKLHNVSSLTDETLVDIAASLEAFSVHPIAKAFSNGSQQLATQVVLSPMQGVEGTINNQRYRIGSVDYCKAWHPVLPEVQSMDQRVGLCSQAAFLGWFELNDNLRPDAETTIASLKKRHLALEIISGDSSSSVDCIGKRLAIPSNKGCSSVDKLELIKRHHQKGHVSMMVGDGINDAPGLAFSHLAVSLDNASDWIKNKTDIVLLNSKLLSIDKVFACAHKYQRIHRQNIVWALGYNIIAIPIAMSGIVSPLFAALGMSLSSIVVVLNSRRLRV